MYREIEFRGNRIDEYAPGTTVDGSLYQNKDGRCFIRVETNDKLDMFEVDPSSVGQYTGMKDRHGHKIFENDLLKLVTKDFCRIFKIVYGKTNRNVELLDGFVDDGTPNTVQINGWLFKLVYASDFDCTEDDFLLLPKVDENGHIDTDRMSIIDTDYYG